MALTETLVVPDDRTPLDKLLFRRFGREVPDLLEATLALNPGLAALGPFPPRGTPVRVVPPPAPTDVAKRPRVQLYS